jgi:hypothetical protein
MQAAPYLIWLAIMAILIAGTIYIVAPPPPVIPYLRQSASRPVWRAQPPKGEHMSGPAESDEPSGIVAVIDPETVQRFATMAMAIPSEDGSGMDRIVDAILSADSWESLADPWESTNAEKLRGKRIIVRSLTRRPSQFRGSLGIFLVVHSAWSSTGEDFVWTTSSVAVVAQLVRAYMLGALPAVVEMVIADRPTEAGYYPHHLRFIAGSVAPAAETA